MAGFLSFVTLFFGTFRILLEYALMVLGAVGLLYLIRALRIYIAEHEGKGGPKGG